MTRTKRFLAILIAIALLFLHMSTCITSVVYALEGDELESGVLAFRINEGDSFEIGDTQINYANGYSLRIEAPGNLTLGRDNGGNAEIRNLPAGQNVTFTLITPENAVLTEEELGQIFLTFQANENNRWIEQFSATETQGEYSYTRSFNFYEGTSEVITIDLDVPNQQNTTGVLAFEIDQQNGDTFAGNTITFANGYTLTATVVGNNAITLGQDNGGNAELRGVPTGASVKFVLTIPEESELIDILVDGAREHFTLDANEEYSYTRVISFESKEVLPIRLDFPNNGGNDEPGNEVESGLLQFNNLGEGYSIEGNTITFANGYTLTMILNADVSLSVDGGGNVLLRDVPSGTEIKFVLTVPEESDLVPLFIGGASEEFTLDANEEYSYSRIFNFTENNNFINIELDFQGNGGNINPGGETTYGVLAFIIDDGDVFEGNTITYANGYSLRIETQGNIALGVDNGGNAEIRNLPAGQNVTFTLITPENNALTNEELERISLSMQVGENNHFNDHFEPSGTQGEYTLVRNFGFNEGEDVVSIRLEIEDEVPTGTLEFNLGENDIYEGNTITFENGYTLTATILDIEENISLVPNGNENNVELQGIPSENSVKFVLGIPDGVQLETFVDQEDGITKLPNPRLVINGVGDIFGYDEELEEYSFARLFHFEGENNLLQVNLEFPDSGDPVHEPIQELTIDFRNPERENSTSWVVRDKTVTATVEGKDLTKGEVVIDRDDVIYLEGFRPRYMEAIIEFVDGDDVFSTKIDVNEDGETGLDFIRAEAVPSHLVARFYIQYRTRDLPEREPLPKGNMPETVVTLSSNIDYAGSFADAGIFINGYELRDLVEDKNKELPTLTTNSFNYYSDENEDTVDITFSSIFVNKFVGSIIINDIPYNVSDYIDYTDRNSFLEHYGSQCTSFTITVPKAERYDIVCNVTELEGEYHWVGNFLWTENENEKYRLDDEGNVIYKDGKPELNDEYIEHALLDLIKVDYWLKDEHGEEIDYTVTREELEENPELYPFIEYDECGSLVVPEGSTVTMKLTPDYGYQIRTFGENDDDRVTASEEEGGLSVFSFPAHKSNFHLNAKAEKVDDVVIPTENIIDVISAGNIEIDKDEIESGTVRLTVDNAELTNEQKASFAEEAGDAYNVVDNYLDVKLDQVLFKGDGDINNAWSTELKDLKKPATVTLTVAEGIDGDTIVILHEKHDGTYEVIQAEYDPIAHTITFTTTSFSNYAIATHKHIPVTKTSTSITKATLTKNGVINTSKVVKCSECGEELGGAGSSKTIYYPKTIKLSTTSYTYNGKAKKPSVIVKDSKGNTISSSNYTVTYASGRKNVGKYKVVVKFKGSYYTGTKTLYFTINPKGVSISKLTANSKGFTAKWGKNTTQTTGYQIQYATNSKFTSNVKTVTVSSNKTVTKTISKLKAKKKYYVRVRTYKTVSGTKYYSAWSSAKTVTTKK